jgi:hypothetical protein
VGWLVEREQISPQTGAANALIIGGIVLMTIFGPTCNAVLSIPQMWRFADTAPAITFAAAAFFVILSSTVVLRCMRQVRCTRVAGALAPPLTGQSGASNEARPHLALHLAPPPLLAAGRSAARGVAGAERGAVRGAVEHGLQDGEQLGPPLHRGPRARPGARLALPLPGHGVHARPRRLQRGAAQQGGRGRARHALHPPLPGEGQRPGGTAGCGGG